MAITHHVMVRAAALRAGYTKFEDYLMIGDDLVIFNQDVSKRYMELLDSIGIGYDPDDSIFPNEKFPIEIAKRLFRFGREISPIPLNCVKGGMSFFLLIQSEYGRTLPSFETHPETALVSEIS